jgi:hypothetical protein
MEPKDGGQLKKVTDISTKRPDQLYCLKTKTGTFVCKVTLDAEDNIEQFIEAVEVTVFMTDRGLTPQGLFIGTILELPGNEDYNDYMLFEVSQKSPYAAEYRKVTSGIVGVESQIIRP